MRRGSARRGPPTAGGVDDDLAVDLAPRRSKPVAVPGAGVAADELGALEDAAAAGGDARHQRVAIRMPVDVAVARAEQAAGEIVVAHLRDEPCEVISVDEATVGHPERPLQVDAAREGLHVGLAVAESQVSVAGDMECTRALEIAEEAHALDPDLDREGVEILGLDDPDRQPGRRAGDPATLDDDDVRDAAIGEVIGGTESECTGSDDDDPRGVDHRAAGPTPR